MQTLGCIVRQPPKAAPMTPTRMRPAPGRKPPGSSPRHAPAQSGDATSCTRELDRRDREHAAELARAQAAADARATALEEARAPSP